MFNKYSICVFIFFYLFIVSINAQSDYLTQWPSFRGPFATGIMDNMDLPVKWDSETGENIKWKTPIPGLGHSCPVVWDDKIFITTAISGSGNDYLKVGLYGNIDNVKDDSEHEFKVYCIDKNSGKILWEKLAHKGVPKTRRHTKASHANCTPATDGKHLIAFFGSEGMFCYDFDGKLLWTKDFGKMNAGPYSDPEVEWGFASSPVIHQGKVIVQCDFLGQSFLASIDVETGQENWRTTRDEISSWSSPNIYSKNGKTHILVNGYKHMGAYDFETGKEIWKMSGGGDAPVPIPIVAHDLIYIHNAHGRYSPIFAISPEATGDITLKKDSLSNKYIKWSIKRGGAYMPTCLVYGDYLYNLRMNGNLTCFNAISGKLIYKEKLDINGGITASGVASDSKLYYSTESGIIYVIKAGKDFKVLAKNQIGDICMASPAISGNAIYFRTQKYLIA